MRRIVSPAKDIEVGSQWGAGALTGGALGDEAAPALSAERTASEGTGAPLRTPSARPG